MAQLLSRRVNNKTVSSDYWYDCSYCEGSGGPDRCGCNPCCICKGKKGYKHTHRSARFLCVGGEFDRVLKAQSELTEEDGYILFNRGTSWAKSQPPRCLFIHQTIFNPTEN